MLKLKSPEAYSSVLMPYGILEESFLFFFPVRSRDSQTSKIRRDQ